MVREVLVEDGFVFVGMLPALLGRGMLGRLDGLDVVMVGGDVFVSFYARGHHVVAVRRFLGGFLMWECRRRPVVNGGSLFARDEVYGVDLR